MKITLIRFVFIATIVSGVGLRIEACTCTRAPSVKADFKAATAVFRGRVLKIMEGQGKVIFKVEERWKGAHGPYVTIDYPSMRTTCSLEFEVGETWLIYADRVQTYADEKATKPIGTEIIADLCGRSSRWTNDVPDIPDLNQLKKNTSMRRHR